MVLKSTSFALFALLVIACSSSSSAESSGPSASDSDKDKAAASAKQEEPKSKSARELELEKNLGGQAIVIVPFDTTKAECSTDDPETMSHETFASCTYLDPTKLPSDFAVTKDPLAFHPATSPSLVLTVLASNVLENAQTNRWYAVIGMGPAPSSSSSSGNGGGSLVKSSIRPLILPAIPLVLGGGALVESATALFAAAAVWFGAKAIVQTGQVLLEQREAATVTQAVGETMKEEAAANKCTIEMVSTPRADNFDCFQAGIEAGPAGCESAIPQYATVQCSSNCTGPSSKFKILCPSYKVCVWEPDLKQCKRAPFSDDISSQIANGCQAKVAAQKASNFCSPKKS